MAGNVRPIIFGALGASRCLPPASAHRIWHGGLGAKVARLRRISPHTRHYNISTSPSGGSSPRDDDIVERAIRLSMAPLHSQVKLQCTRCDQDGAATTSALGKAELAAAYGLSARDLQVVDLPSPGLPHILVRASTILFHVFDLRLLIQADRVLLLHVDGLADTTISRVFTYDLQDKLRGRTNLHAADSTTQIKAAPAPFELRALEAALAAVAAGLDAAYRLARADVRAALHALDAQMSPDGEDASAHTGLRSLLDVARRLADIEQRARLARGALEALLREDRDMADLHLGERQRGHRRAAEDHDDVEYLLEAYCRAHDAVVQEAAALMGDVHRTADTVRAVLATRRNQIMVLETKVEIAMLGMAAATLVAGWYGMNTVNFLEESVYAFAVIATGSVLGGGLIWVFLLRKLRNIRRKHM